LAKFSTKFNLTEYFIKSEENYIMEIPRAVKIDVVNRQVYCAIEINKNRYLGRTVYEPGAQPGTDNSNVAIVAYSWEYGTRLWVAVIGNPYFTDSFGGFDVRAQMLYVVTNSFSTTYTTNSSQTDIYYYRLRSENGYIEASSVLGSPQDDLVMDFQVRFNGIYIYASINDYFLPHRNTQLVWRTANKRRNIVIIEIDFNDKIL
jgi:hypothetical protein